MEWQEWQNEMLEREGELQKYSLLITKTKDKERKSTPIFDGVLAYFPDAIREVARCSAVANAQHNGDAPMHWNKEVSADELGSLTRHLVDLASGEVMDTDGLTHYHKVAWRGLAALQRYLDGEYTEEPEGEE